MIETIRVEQWSCRYGHCQIKISARRDVEEFARVHLSNLENLGKVNLYNNEKRFSASLGRWISRRYYLNNESQVEYLKTQPDINYWEAPENFQRANN